MTDYEVRWAAVARRDLTRIIEFIRDQGRPMAAAGVLDRIEEAVSKLAMLPRIGRVPPEMEQLRLSEHREIIVKPYRILYRLIGEEIVILGVFDARRNLEDLLFERMTSPTEEG